LKTFRKIRDELNKRLSFFRVFSLVLIVLFINAGFFIYKSKTSSSITGFSVNGVRTNIYGIYSKMSLTSKIFLLTQWGLLMLLLIYTLLKDLKIKSKKEELKGVNLQEMSERSKTDLDTLYNILKNKKELRLATIASLFKVKSKVASGWCRTLEDAGLVVVDYPVIGEPVIKIVESEPEPLAVIKKSKY
jgi:hypothetical protein